MTAYNIARKTQVISTSSLPTNTPSLPSLWMAPLSSQCCSSLNPTALLLIFPTHRDLQPALEGVPLKQQSNCILLSHSSALSGFLLSTGWTGPNPHFQPYLSPCSPHTLNSMSYWQHRPGTSYLQLIPAHTPSSCLSGLCSNTISSAKPFLAKPCHLPITLLSCSAHLCLLLSSLLHICLFSSRAAPVSHPSVSSQVPTVPGTG